MLKCYHQKQSEKDKDMSQYTKEVNAFLIKIQQGDVNQLDGLYEITFCHLRAVAEMYLANKSFADDIMNETYEKVLRYSYSFDREQDGYNWMCKIVQNLALSKNKDELRIGLAENAYFYANPAPVLDVEDCLSDISFFEAIKELDEMDRQIAFCRFCLSEPLQTIGDRFGMSRAGIFKRLKKICTVAKKYYEKQ